MQHLVQEGWAYQDDGKRTLRQLGGGDDGGQCRRWQPLRFVNDQQAGRPAIARGRSLQSTVTGVFRRGDRFVQKQSGDAGQRLAEASVAVPCVHARRDGGAFHPVRQRRLAIATRRIGEGDRALPAGVQHIRQCRLLGLAPGEVAGVGGGRIERAGRHGTIGANGCGVRPQGSASSSSRGSVAQTAAHSSHRRIPPPLQPPKMAPPLSGTLPLVPHAFQLAHPGCGST